MFLAKSAFMYVLFCDIKCKEIDIYFRCVLEIGFFKDEVYFSP